MLTHDQIQAVRAHVALDERTQELIRLARADLFNGPNGVHDDSDYPGFSAAVAMITDAIEVTDLYIDTDTDEVIGDTEPSFDPDDECSYSREHVICLDAREVVRTLVGKELLRYV